MTQDLSYFKDLQLFFCELRQHSQFHKKHVMIVAHIIQFTDL